MTHHPADTRRAAVALQYDAATENAPKVIAKGRGLMAEKIIALAREQGIPMREDPDLVQMLTQIDLDREIPKPLQGCCRAFSLRLPPEPKLSTSQECMTFGRPHLSCEPLVPWQHRTLWRFLPHRHRYAPVRYSP